MTFIKKLHQLKKRKNQAGLSALALVFTIAMILTLITASLHLYILLGATRAVQIQSTQAAFFAAEGAMFETIERLRNYPSWPDPGDLPLTYSYPLGEVEVKITISQHPDDPSAFLIDITATIKGVKRRLTAEFSRSEVGRDPLDIILVIDQSGSMEGDPLENAKLAAKAFIDKIEENLANDKIGLVSYSNDAYLRQELTDDFDLIKNPWLKHESQGGLEDLSATNIGDGLSSAISELGGTNARDEARKIIILLSDGVANRPIAGCGGCPHAHSDCTNYAIDKGDEAKSSPINATIFSILLNNITDPDCRVIGRDTLLKISSEPINTPLPPEDESLFYYRETKDPDELKNIYKDIAEEITTPGFFEVWEEVPIPD